MAAFVFFFFMFGHSPEATASLTTVCEAVLKSYGPKVVINEGPLQISSDHWVRWRGKRVFITFTRARKNSAYRRNAVLGRLLIALVDRKNRLVEPAELYGDVWPGRLTPDFRRQRAEISVAVQNLKRLFLKVDPEFNEIKIKKFAGYAWDTGERHDSMIRGSLKLNPGMQEVFFKGIQLPMTSTQFRILQELARQPGRKLSPREVFASFAVLDNTQRMEKEEGLIAISAAVEIAKIRQVFKMADEEFDCIQRNPPSEGWWWDERDRGTQRPSGQ